MSRQQEAEGPREQRRRAKRCKRSQHGGSDSEPNKLESDGLRGASGDQQLAVPPKRTKVKRAGEKTSDKPDGQSARERQSGIRHGRLPCIQRQADESPIAAPSIKNVAEKNTCGPDAAPMKMLSSHRPRSRPSSIGTMIIQPRTPICPSREPSDGSGFSRPNSSRSNACRATRSRRSAGWNPGRRRSGLMALPRGADIV